MTSEKKVRLIKGLVNRSYKLVSYDGNKAILQKGRVTIKIK